MDTLKLNSKIELISEDEEITSGLVQDIVDNKILVSIPSDDKQFKILRVGDKVRGIIYDGDNALDFDGIISARIAGGIPTYEVLCLTDLSKVQRREDFRVNHAIPMFYSKDLQLLKDIEIERPLKEISKDFKRAMMIDISGGGVRLSCNENLHIDDRILLLFELGSRNIISEGRIVYKVLSVSPRETRYTYGIGFVGMNEGYKEEIIRNVFTLMRRNILK